MFDFKPDPDARQGRTLSRAARRGRRADRRRTRRRRQHGQCRGAAGGVPARLNWAGFYRMVDGESWCSARSSAARPASASRSAGRVRRGGANAANATCRGRPRLSRPYRLRCGEPSELVVPVVSDGAVIAVIDLDSPWPARFGAADADGYRGAGGLYCGSDPILACDAPHRDSFSRCARILRDIPR